MKLMTRIYPSTLSVARGVFLLGTILVVGCGPNPNTLIDDNSFKSAPATTEPEQPAVDTKLDTQATVACPPVETTATPAATTPVQCIKDDALTDQKRSAAQKLGDPKNKFKKQAPVLAIQTTQTPKTDPKTDPKAATPIQQVPVKTAAENIHSWDISGAIAARTPRKAWTASINWLQSGPTRYQIRLFGPAGSGTMLIERNGNQVVLKEGGKTATASSADQLLAQQTGIRLPVTYLYYWVRGVPAPGKIQSSRHDASNRLVELRQAGYFIEYGGYTQAGKASVPSQIRLNGNGVTIKLVIKRWSAR